MTRRCHDIRTVAMWIREVGWYWRHDLHIEGLGWTKHGRPPTTLGERASPAPPPPVKKGKTE